MQRFSLILAGLISSCTLLPCTSASGQTETHGMGREILWKQQPSLPTGDITAKPLDGLPTRSVLPDTPEIQLPGREGEILKSDILQSGLRKRIPKVLLDALNAGASEKLAQRRDWDSMIISEAEGRQAIALLAPRPSEMLGHIAATATPKSQLCTQTADHIEARPGLVERLRKSYQTANLTPEEQTLIREFTDLCFASPFHGSTDPSLAAIAARAAILEIDINQGREAEIGNRGYCSALFIDSQRVATARHCLFSGNSRIGSASVKVIPIGSQVTALTRIPVEIDSSYDLPGKQASWTSNVAEDFVILKLAGSPPLMLAPLGFASEEDLRTGEAFYQVGYQHLVSLATGKYPRTIEDFRAAYRLDKSKYCIAIDFTPTCLIQGCQSLQKTSGAAFLVRRGGSVKLAATLFGGGDLLASQKVADCFDPATPRNTAKLVNLSSRAK